MEFSLHIFLQCSSILNKKDLKKGKVTSPKKKKKKKVHCDVDIFAAHVDVFIQGYAKIYVYKFCQGQ